MRIKIPALLIVFAIGITGLQAQQVKAAVTVFTDKAAFLAATGATSATGPLPFLGSVSSAKVGSLTFSNTSGSSDPSVALSFGINHPLFTDLTPLLPGHDLAIGDFEDLNITSDTPILSFGFDFAEHMTTPSEEGSLCGGGSGCIDSVFTVSLLLDSTLVDSFSFNAPNDVASFVGVLSTAPFNRVQIRESRTQGGAENDYFGQFYTGGRSAGEFDINITAFIPGNNMSAWPRKCFTVFSPRWRGLFVKTDDRSFDPKAKTYRTRQTVTVVPDETANPNGRKPGTGGPLLKQPTRLYASNALAVIDDNDDDGTPDDCSFFHVEELPLVNRDEVTVTRVGPKQVRVHLRGAVGTGAAFGIGHFVDISWDAILEIDTSGPSPHVTIQGAHDGFPAYEVYVNDHEIYTHSPGSPPYGIRDLQKLGGRLEVTIPTRMRTIP